MKIQLYRLGCCRRAGAGMSYFSEEMSSIDAVLPMTRNIHVQIAGDGEHVHVGTQRRDGSQNHGIAATLSVSL